MPDNPGVQMQRFLSSVDYPTSKQSLIERARARGDDERVRQIVRVLESLPTQEFNSRDDVTKAMSQGH